MFLGTGNEVTAIERCKVGNLLQKLHSGELESQLRKCQENYAHIILLVEDVNDKVGKLLAVHRCGDRGYFRVKVYPMTYYSYIKATEIRLQEMGIEYIDSPNYSCTIDIIKTIYEQRTKTEDKHTLFKSARKVAIPTRYTKNPAVSKLLALCPRLSEKTAIGLVERYGTIWAILNTDDKELMEVDGFGKTLLQRLKDGVGKE